jgi:hypothetical protein
MREVMVRIACFTANLILGEPRLVVTEEEERALAASRVGNPYFNAFRRRCMLWVYGDDPRRAPSD